MWEGLIRLDESLLPEPDGEQRGGGQRDYLLAGLNY